MTDSSPSAAAYYAATYDVSVPDWPGEIDFYLSLARDASGDILELAAGTGRICIRLAEAAFEVTALDRSPEMLAVGRGKSTALPNLRWVEADMRSFDLGRQFGLIIVPGHSFLNLTTTRDQVDCLASVKHHLIAGGRLVLHLDHQDVDWLGTLMGPQGGLFEPAESFVHPVSGRDVRTERAWRYERSTQTAVVRTRWTELDDAGKVLTTIETEEHRIHAAFRFEVEHLLARSGFAVEGLYGDFDQNPLADASSEMIFVATSDLTDRIRSPRIIPGQSKATIGTRPVGGAHREPGHGWKPGGDQRHQAPPVSGRRTGPGPAR